MSDIKVSIRLADPSDLNFIRQRGHLPGDEVILRKIQQGEFIILSAGHQPEGLLSLEFLWSVVPFLR